jgi:hypothetical protein
MISMLERLHSGAQNCSLVSLQDSIGSSNVSPCNPNWCRCSADTGTFCISWLNVHMFGTNEAHISMLDTISHAAILLFPRITSSRWQMVTLSADAG